MTDKPRRTLMRCSCHRRAIMGVVKDDVLEFRKEIHGEEHVLLTKIANGCIVEIINLNTAPS